MAGSEAYVIYEGTSTRFLIIPSFIYKAAGVLDGDITFKQEEVYFIKTCSFQS